MAESASPVFHRSSVPVALQQNERQPVLCRYHMHGACRWGRQCSFSHDLHKSAPSSVCRFYLRGNCSYGSGCRFDHVKNQPTPNQSSENHKPDSSKHKPHQPNVFRDKTSVASKPVPLKKKGRSSERASSAGPLRTVNRDPFEWVKAAEFVPGRPYKAVPTYSEAVGGKDQENQDLTKQKDQLCPYYIHGHCEYGENCVYTHGDVCDLCGTGALYPGDEKQNQMHRKACIEEHEKAMEESFAHQRSKDQVCGICMEVVMEKSFSERKFGILSNCKHVYCLGCIRKWRSAKQFEKQNVKSCPECRVKSDFITPSKFWAETDEDKKKLMDSYKAALSKKSCKYFNQGRGECPFYDKCFYLHAYPNGTIAEPKPRPPRRRYVDAEEHIDLIEHILLLDFLEERENQLLYDMDSELYDILLGYDYSSDDSDDFYIF